MCELIGFSAARPTDIKEQLKEFFSHSASNPHGWGIMYGDRLIRGCERASDSVAVERLLQTLEDQTTTMGHIRFATVGSIKLENCHPFTGRDITGRQWTLIHNGTIYSGSSLIPYLNNQSGDTDSERLFLFLMDTLNSAQQNGELSQQERCELVDNFIKEMSHKNKLNLMIYDGELLYIHKNMKDTMLFRKMGSGYIFSTTALDDSEWNDVPIAQLMVYKEGEQVYIGRQHDGIFTPSLQYIKAMDAMHI
ncbi:MAG: class II glutamine amidotransferase [Ruminococcus sp.]|uniref:class II glutamine amidotransferase n=1 Tax=Ruminococcus sp. TaxID=41978 RepID=UPI0025DB95A9|nr:class II glutamine amidotransferase [Ruminococcus sp.]MBO4866437.1 class II glutamine amidotransferase [Ruminococcus sp.]